MEIKQKTCPDCGKVVTSIYDKQLDYNYKAHLLACKKTKLREDKIMEEMFKPTKGLWNVGVSEEDSENAAVKDAEAEEEVPVEEVESVEEAVEESEDKD